MIYFSIFQILASVAMFFVNSYATLMVALFATGVSMAMVMIPRRVFSKY